MANESQSDRSRRNESIDYLNDRPRSTRPSGTAAKQEKSSAPTRKTGTARTASSSKSASSSARSGAGTGTKRRLSKKKRQQRRMLVFAVLFLLFAVIVLVTAIMLASTLKNGGCNRTQTDSNPSAPITADASPLSTPVPSILPVSDETLIEQNVSVNGISLRGKTVGSARQLLMQGLSELMHSLNVKVIVDQYSMVLTDEKIGMDYDEDALEEVLVSAANATGQTELSIPLTHDETLLRTSLAELNDQLPNHATNAKAEVLWKQNKIKSSGEIYVQPYWSYTEGTNGMAVDSADVLRQVEEALASGNFSTEIRPEVTISEPAITVEMLKKQTTLLGECVTTYYFTGTSSTNEDIKLNRENRDINISKAVDLMKVIQLAPGKQFSYNKKTGSRTEKNGWALANAIYQGSHRPEPGGGVCQLSTTMYNALLLANIRIDSRRAHSMPVDYVDKGWDATVDDSHIDFKFTNNTKGTLYIFCYITKNANSSRKKDIHVEVYGMAFPDGTTYKKRSELVEELPIPEETIKDKTMFVGDNPVVEREGSKGWIVNTFIDQYVNGKLVKTVYSTTTTYEPISKKIRIGTKPDPTPSPTATPKPTKTPKPAEEETEAPDGDA